MAGVGRVQTDADLGSDVEDYDEGSIRLRVDARGDRLVGWERGNVRTASFVRFGARGQRMEPPVSVARAGSLDWDVALAGAGGDAAAIGGGPLHGSGIGRAVGRAVSACGRI